MRIEIDRTLLPFGGNAPSPEFYVAVSGGVDSIAAATLLECFHGTSMGIVHFNHKLRPQNELMEQRTREFAANLGVKFIVGHRSGELEKGSVEDALRKHRLAYFDTVGKPIVLAHHLDDAVESYFMNFLRGRADEIPIAKKREWGNTILLRPFLTTKKEAFEEFACKHDKMRYVVTDETNSDNAYRRNWARNEVLPQLEKFGLRKIVRKKFYS